MTPHISPLSHHKNSPKDLAQSFKALIYELFSLEVAQADAQALHALGQSYGEFDFGGAIVCFASAASSETLSSSSLGHTNLAFSLICSKSSATLSKSLYAKATQAINRAIPSYNIIFFLNPQEDLLTISFATRREHKRAADQDVLERVIIIKDLSLLSPSKGHLRNLDSIAKASKHKKQTPTPIDQLYQESIKALSIESLNEKFYQEVVQIFISLIDSIQLPTPSLRADEIGAAIHKSKVDSSGGDSALGNHSADLANFEATADPKSSSAPKFAKNRESTTTNPRILQEASGTLSSLRADEIGAAIHKDKAQKVDSSNEADSKKTAQNLNDSQAAGFADDFVGCQGVGEGIYLSGNEQAHAADSRKSAAKPTPKTQKVDSSSDNTKREFSLRLLSRLLFCKFLEKKGIIDTAIFSTTLSGNYYHEVLEPLFFTTLNTPKNARDYALLDPHIAALLEQIPYLNGGLFAPQASDFYSPSRPTAYHTTLKVPNAPLAELFTLLESYHFSIDESTPDAQEVGLNPELLGMVFESLLSELFTDNRKDSTSSLRKSTGSYYTPREIVQYMCRSSLYQYLLTKLDSAFGLESRISSPRLCDSHSRLISARGSKSHDSSSKILESTISDKTAAQKSRREQTALESSFACHTEPLGEVSSPNAPTPSLRGSGDSHNEAIHKDKAQKMDSSGLPRSLTTSRNDSKNAANKKVDSRNEAQNLSDSQAAGLCDNNTKAENVFDSQAVGGRIFDEKAGLCSGEQGDKTQVSIDAASHKLAAFSQNKRSEVSLEKANAQNAKVDSSQAIHSLIFHQDPSHLPPTTHAQILAALSTLKVLDPACGSGAFPIGLMQEILDLQDLLGDTRSPYTRKLEILQSNIYGIDIQPMATEISRLRCFLSLIVDESPHSIAPLPNLEFKFLSANSLLPLPQDSTLEYDGYQADKQKLESIRQANFTADLKSRESLKQDYLETAAHIARNLILHDQGENPLTLWNPYDPHSVAGFFDSEYMFGLQGFDIVIGNPPYGATYPAEHKPIFKKHYKSARTINEREAKRLYPAQWQDKLQVGSLNTYSLFIEQSYNLCATQGIVSLIVPMSVTASESMQGLHKLLLNNCESIWVSSYGERPAKIFTNAEQKVSIISFIKNNTKTKNLLTTGVNKRYSTTTIKQVLDGLTFTNSINFIKSGRLPKISYQIEADILRKMYSLDSTIADFICSKNKGLPIYYRSSGNRYYNLITTFSTKSSKEKCFFVVKKYQKVISAILSSNLYFWFRSAYSNQRDTYIYEFEIMSIPISLLTESKIKEISKLCDDLENHIEISANFTSTGTKEYRLRKSKHIIDKIDRLICPLYGLTEQETEFIINYDLQFRTDD